MVKNSFLVVLILFVFGCAPKIIVNKSVANNQIAICINYEAIVSQDIQNSIDSVADQFINDYNQNNGLTLIKCQNDNQRTLNLDVLNIRITTPSQQAGGVAITALGTLMPIFMIAMGSPFYIWFGYLPRSYIRTKYNLSEDISFSDAPSKKYASCVSDRYFGEYETQKQIVMNKFYQQLLNEVTLIEENAK